MRLAVSLQTADQASDLHFLKALQGHLQKFAHQAPLKMGGKVAGQPLADDLLASGEEQRAKTKADESEQGGVEKLQTLFGEDIIDHQLGQPASGALKGDGEDRKQGQANDVLLELEQQAQKIWG